MTYILAIDQGTTSSRAIVFDAEMHPVATAQKEFTQFFPASGWVEHDAEEIWTDVLEVCRNVMEKAGVTASDIAGIGITNQRETTVVWDAETGVPIHRAIVWQDRRTADFCAEVKAAGGEAEITARTGLLADPYFSGTKVRWILREHNVQPMAETGRLRFGTIDSWLIWKFTKGGRHVIDATNASRTMMYDIHVQDWSDEMLRLLDVPRAMLPQVLDCAAPFGTTDVFGGQIPILGVAGDQQAATIGQACFEPGMLKSTYGTGCFALLNTGAQPVTSQNRLLTTVAYRMNGEVTYALEGAIFVAGAVVQWLRDGLGLINAAPETEALAPDGRGSVVIVPAFTGLGAPYWHAECRGAVFGLTRDTSPADMARAALESVALQTHDLLAAMQADWPDATQAVLRVDGGLSANDWAMQCLADVLAAPVDRPQGVETTALGAAWLAGMQASVYPDLAGFAETWRRDKRFVPAMREDVRAPILARWARAVQATMAV